MRRDRAVGNRGRIVDRAVPVRVPRDRVLVHRLGVVRDERDVGRRGDGEVVVGAVELPCAERIGVLGVAGLRRVGGGGRCEIAGRDALGLGGGGAAVGVERHVVAGLDDEVAVAVVDGDEALVREVGHGAGVVAKLRVVLRERAALDDEVLRGVVRLVDRHAGDGRVVAVRRRRDVGVGAALDGHRRAGERIGAGAAFAVHGNREVGERDIRAGARGDRVDAVLRDGRVVLRAVDDAVRDRHVAALHVEDAAVAGRARAGDRVAAEVDRDRGVRADVRLDALREGHVVEKHDRVAVCGRGDRRRKRRVLRTAGNLRHVVRHRDGGRVGRRVGDVRRCGSDRPAVEGIGRHRRARRRFDDVVGPGRRRSRGGRIAGRNAERLEHRAVVILERHVVAGLDDPVAVAVVDRDVTIAREVGVVALSRNVLRVEAHERAAADVESGVGRIVCVHAVQGEVRPVRRVKRGHREGAAVDLRRAELGLDDRAAAVVGAALDRQRSAVAHVERVHAGLVVRVFLVEAVDAARGPLDRRVRVDEERAPVGGRLQRAGHRVRVLAEVDRDGVRDDEAVRLRRFGGVSGVVREEDNRIAVIGGANRLGERGVGADRVRGDAGDRDHRGLGGGGGVGRRVGGHGAVVGGGSGRPGLEGVDRVVRDVARGIGVRRRVAPVDGRGVGRVGAVGGLEVPRDRVVAGRGGVGRGVGRRPGGGGEGGRPAAERVVVLVVGGLGRGFAVIDGHHAGQGAGRSENGRAVLVHEGDREGLGDGIELRGVGRGGGRGNDRGRPGVVEGVGVFGRLGLRRRRAGVGGRLAVVHGAGAERVAIAVEPRDHVLVQVVLRRDEEVLRDRGGEVVVGAVGLPGVEGVAGLRGRRGDVGGRDGLALVNIDRADDVCAVLERDRVDVDRIGAVEVRDAAGTAEGDGADLRLVLVRQGERRTDLDVVGEERNGLGLRGVVEHHLHVDRGGRIGNDGGGELRPDQGAGRVRLAGPAVVGGSGGAVGPLAEDDGGLGALGEIRRRLVGDRERGAGDLDRGGLAGARGGFVGDALAVVEVEGHDASGNLDLRRIDAGSEHPLGVGAVARHGVFDEDAVVHAGGGRGQGQHHADGGGQQGL